jgi:hypothetical protein
MRSVLSATLMIAASGFAASDAQAQLTPPATAGAKAETCHHDTDPPRAAEAGGHRQRDGAGRAAGAAIGPCLGRQYNGAITGDLSERMVNAIKEFQKTRGGASRPACSIRRSAASCGHAKKKQESVGWKIVTDPGTGVRLGIPTKLVPQQASDANGTKWTSPTGTIQIQLTRRKEAGPVTAKLAEREKKRAGAQHRLHRGQAGLFSCCPACRA